MRIDSFKKMEVDKIINKATGDIKNIVGCEVLLEVNYIRDWQADKQVEQKKSIEAFTLITNITLAALKKKNRKSDVVELRQLFCYYMHKVLKYTCTEVAQLIERDHTTILYACMEVNKLVIGEHKGTLIMLNKINDAKNKIQINELDMEKD